jgi:hypothetical protein
MKGSFYLPVAYLAQAREAWKFIDA